MTLDTVACGAGGRDLDGVPNVLRLTIGRAASGDDAEADAVWLLETNLDDMTGEQIAFCAERLRSGGALDVFATPVQMKKGRPGVVLSALCDDAARVGIERLIFAHTSTFGVRRTLWQRTKLARAWRSVETPWGAVRMKTARLGERELRCEPEYEDCRALAEANDVPLADVQQAARRAAAE
jgi:pyridinium-3,5-bisthiocarboxylic acid mononucleotide nickel chelatase